MQSDCPGSGRKGQRNPGPGGENEQKQKVPEGTAYEGRLGGIQGILPEPFKINLKMKETDHG